MLVYEGERAAALFASRLVKYDRSSTKSERVVSRMLHLAISSVFTGLDSALTRKPIIYEAYAVNRK